MYVLFFPEDMEQYQSSRGGEKCSEADSSGYLSVPPGMFCNAPGYGKSYYFDFLCRTYYNAREFELQTEAKGMAESGVGVG